jgi:hypothetical protein
MFLQFQKSFMNKNSSKAIFLIIATLVFLLPFQTIISTLLVNVFKLPVILTLWKEALTLLIIFIVSYYYIKEFLQNKINTKLTALFLTLAIGLITLISYSILYYNLPINIVFLSLRFDLFWLVFLIAGYFGVKINDNLFANFVKQAPKLFTFSFSFLAIFILFYSFIGQTKVMQALGFSNGESFQISPQACHNIDFSLNNCRLSGGFSSPNHFAGYLLIVLPFLIINFNHTLKTKSKVGIIANLILITSNLIFIYFSYARFALLGIIPILVFILTELFLRHSKFNLIKRTIVFFGLAFPIFISIVALNLPESILIQLPNSISKPSSTIIHSRRTFSNIQILQNRPEKILTGYGLGSSGPVAKIEYYDVEKYALIKENAPVAYQYMLLPQDLTIPENWFLQLLMQGGIFYLISNMFFIFLPISYLINYFKNKKLDFDIIIVIFGLIAIIIGNTLLHIWEAQTVSLYYSIAAIWIFYKYKLATIKRTC